MSGFPLYLDTWEDGIFSSSVHVTTSDQRFVSRRMHVTSGWSISLSARDLLAFSSLVAAMVEASIKKESPPAWFPEKLMSRAPADPHQTCSIGRL